MLCQTGADVKWVETANIHITLKFLGNVDASRLQSVQAALEEALASHRPFYLRYKGCGVFPNRRRPRVVWIGTEGDLENLRALQFDIDTALEPLSFSREKRHYSPHVTVGRMRSDKNASRLVERLDTIQGEDYGLTKVDTVSLMESQLSPKGPTYRHVHDVSLAK